MTREIALDTETTGLDPFSGDRLVEIGCVELISGIRTGKVFHAYLNPQRDMPDGAYRVHGLSSEFLKDKKIFSEEVDGFLEFIQDSPLVIHNATFDMKFVNYELKTCGFAEIPMKRAVDTLLMARKKFPGSPASLDALCKRFLIDLSGREKHGALLDAELLADVYLELMGGRQVTLGLDSNADATSDNNANETFSKNTRPARAFPVGDAELAAHAHMVSKLKEPVWQD